MLTVKIEDQVEGARFNWYSRPGCDYQEANI